MIDQLTREAELIAAEAARATRLTPSAVPGVYRAIANVSGEIAKSGIAKDQRNQQQGYAFRGIDSVMNALAPLLAAHGLVILPRVLGRETTERATKGGGVLYATVLDVEFDFVFVGDGSSHTVRVVGEAMDSADKSCNKSMSAAYKYAAFQTFCIPTEGDSDADATTPDVLPQAPTPPVTAAPADREGAATAEPPVGDRGSRPDPPYGYVYIDDYKHAGGWHDVRVGRTKYSTKTAVGRIAGDAWGTGRPVKLDSKPKENSPGEHWLNGVTVWNPPAEEPPF